MTRIKKCRDDYTVGWIAALPIEQAAATAMLDEEHGWPNGFSKPRHDSNSYAWGRIKDKNIVIAVLPVGITGKVAAATTANQLLAAFPQVRIGLMVGIGGGIPRPDDDVDIRLGDIVVSQPSGTHGGVIQYDLGKAKLGGVFERKGYLSAPPRTLLTALARIQGQHERYASSVPEILAEMLEKNPRMRSKAAGYTHQGKENDRLFQASYTHNGAKTCEDCDPAGEIEREDREETDPHIHYGIIASGDKVVKDAALRDAILDQVGDECKCLDMEAAGLMNDFPCVVIRGISNYADSHKNDHWYRYAAATAAAYAKEFLGFIKEEDLKRETRVTESMQINTSNAYCIFVDGLNEISDEDGSEALLKTLDELQSCKANKIKLCVSSRLEYRFLERIKVARELKLHLVNEKDMKKYAWTHLNGDLPTEDEQDALDLDPDSFLGQIVRLLLVKAEGVFLWLVLAVQSILRGFRNKDSNEEILLRVEQLPSDLKSLYQDMWNRMNIDEPIYRDSAARMLSFMIEFHKTGDSVQLLEIGFLLNLMSPLDVVEGRVCTRVNDVSKLLLTAERAVSLRSAGLLKVGPVTRDFYHSPYGQRKAREGVNRQVTFIHRTAYDYLTSTTHGRSIIACENQSRGALCLDIAKCRLAAARCFDPSPGIAGRWEGFHDLLQTSWMHFIAKAIEIGDDIVAQASTALLDLCSTLFDVEYECPTASVKTIAPLASYLLTRSSLLDYVFQRIQPESITRVLQLSFMLLYYALHDEVMPVESFHQCLEFGAKIEPRMSFPTPERPSKETADFRETILETLVFHLLEREYSSGNYMSSQIGNRHPVKRKFDRERGHWTKDQVFFDEWLTRITQIAECILALHPTVQDLQQTLPLWRTVLEDRWTDVNTAVFYPGKDYMHRYVGCEKTFTMSERPSPQIKIFKHRGNHCCWQVDITFEANVARLLAEPLMILALHEYPIDNIKPLKKLAELTKLVAPSVKVFYVLGTPRENWSNDLYIDEREVAFSCNFDTEGNTLLCTTLDFEKIIEFLQDDSRLNDTEIVDGKLGKIGSSI